MAKPNVITNIRSIVAQICRDTKQQTNILHTVFSDADGDYREIIESFRKQNFHMTKQEKSFPLLAHSRSPLRYSEELGMRMTNESTPHDYNGSEIEIKAALIEFDFNFTFITTSPAEAEEFEAIYMLYKGLVQAEQVTVNATVIDMDFDFDIDFQDLTSKSLSTQDNKYFMFQGEALVKGPILLITGEAHTIKEINQTLKSFDEVEYP